MDADCHKKKLYWYKSSNTFFCFKCDFSGDIFSLVAQKWKLQGKQYIFPEVINYVMSICGFENTKFERKQKADIYDWQSDLSKYLHIETQQNVMKIYDKSVLNFFEDIYHQSWLNEGISIETLMKYNIKYYPFRNEIIIPDFREDGELIGIRNRALNPDDIEILGKYRPTQLLDGTTFKFPSSGFLYGEYQNANNIAINRKCLITESEKSVLQAESIFRDDNFTVAMLGKNLSKRNRDWVVNHNVDEVIIGIDFDYTEYGDADYDRYKKDVLKIAKMFAGFCKVSVLCSHGGHKMKDSPTDNGKEFYMNLWNNREVIE